MNNFSLSFKGIDFNSISKGFSKAQNLPSAIFAVTGLIILAFIFVKVRKVKLTTNIITNVGVALALGTVLKMIKFFQLPNGGSATLGSMIPILIIALFYGTEIGLLTGLLFGLLDFILGPFIMHPVQVLFDYPLAFTALGVAGFFKDKEKPQMLFGVLLAISCRFLSHFISGIIFYGSYAKPGQSAVAYSFFYNLSYLGPEAVLCILILSILPVKQLYASMVKTKLNT